MCKTFLKTCRHTLHHVDQYQSNIPIPNKPVHKSDYQRTRVSTVSTHAVFFQNPDLPRSL